jgi:glycosyltransferase involved in cell wall biosynthesis
MCNVKKISFSIVICTLNNVTGLEKCINSITQQTLIPNEIIIVHGDSNKEMEKSITKKIRPILQSNLIALKYIKTIRSLVSQRNIGIDNASGDVIVFLDDDVILEKDYFFYLFEVYQSKWNENLGGVQGSIIEASRGNSWSPIEVIRKIFLYANITGSGRLLASVNPSFCGNPQEIKKVDIFNGCMMSFRRDILLKNRFDTNFKEFWMCDDIELSYRISRKYHLYQTPLARLHHIPSAPNYEGRRKMTRMLVYNRFYMFRLYFCDSKINWILFFWSNIGEFLLRILNCLRISNLGALLGFLEGWKLVFIDKGHPYRKKMGERNG